MLLQPGRGVRLQRPASDLSRYPAGLLGRRQPVSPPSASRPAARRFRPPGNGRRARIGLDGNARAMPTSSCRRRSRWSARISAPPPAIRCWSRCTGRCRPMARRATITRSSPGWPSGSGLPTALPRAARRGNGSNISTSRPAARWPSAASTRRILPQFWEDGELDLPTLPWDGGIVRAFRRDPDAAPLPTPSGRIEIASATIAGFGYADCPGHPAWLPPAEGAGLAAGGALSAAIDRQPAGDPVAQPAGFRRDQPRVEGRGPRAGAHPSRMTPLRAASPTATSCGSTTIAAPASPARC